MARNGRCSGASVIGCRRKVCPSQLWRLPLGEETNETGRALTGFIPPDGILSFSEPATLRSIEENKKASSFDSLDKALIIFRHPANRTTRPRDHYRRVDLIFARWPNFGAAVLGWSGSTQFERDLRKHAEKL